MPARLGFMNTTRAFQMAGASAAVIAVAGASIAVGAGSTPKVTRTGVGAVKIGKTYTKLRAQHLVGKITHGCELGAPNTRSAKLKKPLLGAVNFTLHKPRKVTDVQIEGGATA